MLQYVIAGLVFGSLYAITASGLTVTYLSTGVLNFSFGATAYVIARLYYYLDTTQGWPIWSALMVSVVLVGPALGVVLYLVLFQHLRLASTLTKIVATIGLVQDGDKVLIDIPNRSINLLISDEELAARRVEQDKKGWKPVEKRPRKVTTALKAYALLATSADKGAVRNKAMLDGL